jgi:hypothetical protein
MEGSGQMTQQNATSKLLAIWEIIRPAMKQHGASLHQKDGRFWLLMPIAPETAPEILSHPAIVVDDDQSTSTHQCFRWRASSVLRKILNAGSVLQ